MSPSHSNKKGKRYRYYISQALIQHRKQDAGTISKVPAGEIEKVVTQEIQDFVLNSSNIQPMLQESTIHKQKAMLNNVVDKIDGQFIRTVLSKVVIYKEKVEITICQNQLLKIFEAIYQKLDLPEELKSETGTPIILTKNIKITATSRNGSVLILTDSDMQQPEINPQLVKAIAKSYLWNKQLLSGEVKDFKEIKEREGHKDSRYVVKVINLRFLAPDIIELILNGTQQRDLSLQKLFNIETLDWSEQRKILGF